MNDTPRGWFARALDAPHATRWIALLAVALVLPTLNTGLILDDWSHRMLNDPTWHHPGSVRGPWELYRFITDDPDFRRISMDRGILPWWIAPGFRLAFLRPISSLSVAVDHTLLAGHPWVWHLENALWFGALTLSAAAVFKATLKSARLVALATLLVAVDHTHAMLTLWISNRHAVLSAVFAFASLAMHIRWREEQNSRARNAAIALFTVALLCGESTFSIGGYLLAYTLWNDPDRTPRRWRALAPYAAVVAVWAVVYRLQGCGAYGGDFYIDPVRQPITFLHAVVKRMPILALGQVGLPPSEFVGPRPLYVSVIIAAALAVMSVPIWKLVRHHPLTRMWIFGALTALLPGCATFPGDRLLLFSGLGVMALLATAFERAWWSGERPSLSSRALLGVLAVIHLGLSPLLLPARALNIAHVAAGFVDRGDHTIPDDDALRRQMLMVVTSPDSLLPMYVMGRRYPEGRAVPAGGYRYLSLATQGTTTLRRDGPRSVVITSSAGFPHEQFGALYRGSAHPFHVGEVVVTAGMRVTVLSVTPDGLARETRFEWARDLEDPGYRWIWWRNLHFEAFPVPPIGGTVTLEPIDWLRAMMGS